MYASIPHWPPEARNVLFAERSKSLAMAIVGKGLLKVSQLMSTLGFKQLEHIENGHFFVGESVYPN